MSEENLKVLLLGKPGVGKTCLAKSLVWRHFVTYHDLNIEESYRKMMSVEGKRVMLEVVDCEMDVRTQKGFLDMWIRQGDVFLILYSVGDFESFREVKKYWEFVYRVQDRGDLAIVVVGHQSDLVRKEVSTEEGEEYVGLHEGVLFMEVSSKTGENVEEVFRIGVKKYLELRRGSGEGEEVGKGEKKKQEWVDPPIVHEVMRGKTVKPAKKMR